MRRRITALLAVAAIAAIGLVAQTSPASSGAGGPIGYTYVARFLGSPTQCLFLAIDLSTGVAEQRNEEGVRCADGLTFAPDGTLYGYRGQVTQGNAGAATLVRIDPATGAQTDIGPPLPEVFFGSGGMTFDAAGNLWLYAATSGDEECQPSGSPWCLWQVDPTNAATSLVGPINSLTAVFGLAGTCSGEVQAITTDVNNGFVSGTALQSVDTATAAVSEIVPLDDVFLPGGLDYDSAGGLWAIGSTPVEGRAGSIQVHSIDPATGDSVATTVLLDNDDIFGIAGGLAISPIGSCPPPPPPTPTPEVVVLQPTFTG